MSEQAKAGATNTGSNQSLIYADGISKPFNAFDYAQKTFELQRGSSAVIRSNYPKEKSR